MSNKSLFEKLFEDVMENDALGINNKDTQDTGTEDFGDGEKGGLDDDFGDGDTDTVTITLSRSLAKELKSALEEVLADEDMGSEVPEKDGLEGGEGGEAEDDEGWSEDAEDSEDEDSESCEDDEDEDEVKKESPQAEYKPFTNKGETLTKKGNAKVGGIAGKATAHGKAVQTSQTQGTEKYMPMNTKYDDGKSMKVKSSEYTPSGPGKSMFG
jgi:hypothetical protein